MQCLRGMSLADVTTQGVPLTPMFAAGAHLTNLGCWDLCSADMQTAGTAAVAAALPCLNSLTRLRLCRARIDRSAASALGAAIAALPLLSVLEITAVDFAEQPGLFPLVLPPRPGWRSVQLLRLDGCHLDEAAMLALAMLLTFFPVLSSYSIAATRYSCTAAAKVAAILLP